MRPMEIRIVLVHLEPPCGRLRVVSAGGARRCAKEEEISFTGWLGLLRALYEVTGADSVDAMGD
jgi:hypothetical protein